MPQERPRSGRTGFTFVEVVASLAIVMCVLGMLLPVFLRGKHRAREVGCGSNLHQLASVLHLYAQDHDGWFPPRDHDAAPVMAYIKNKDVLVCPDEPQASRQRWKSGATRTGVKDVVVEAYSSFEYRGGLASDDANTEPMARDWGAWHRGGVNVLNLGGQVKWVRGEGAHLTSSPRPAPPADLAAPKPLDASMGSSQGE